MSLRGNCQDNAVAESFFSSLKKEHIRKRIYKTRALARADSYRGYPTRIYVAYFTLSPSFSVCTDLACLGITPFLPKAEKPPVTRATTGLRRDPPCKTILYVFGFLHHWPSNPVDRLAVYRSSSLVHCIVQAGETSDAEAFVRELAQCVPYS